MKRISLFLLSLGILLSCSEKTYVKDYNARLETNGGTLAPMMALPEGISAQEKDALQFLYAYMPLADITDYSPEFYLQSVRSSLRAREEMEERLITAASMEMGLSSDEIKTYMAALSDNDLKALFV